MRGQVQENPSSPYENLSSDISYEDRRIFSEKSSHQSMNHAQNPKEMSSFYCALLESSLLLDSSHFSTRTKKMCQEEKVPRNNKCTKSMQRNESWVPSKKKYACPVYPREEYQSNCISSTPFTESKGQEQKMSKPGNDYFVNRKTGENYDFNIKPSHYRIRERMNASGAGKVVYCTRCGRSMQVSQTCSLYDCPYCETVSVDIAASIDGDIEDDLQRHNLRSREKICSSNLRYDHSRKMKGSFSFEFSAQVHMKHW